jgi:hypothetical protein
MALDPVDHDALTDLLRRKVDAWKRHDFAALKLLWDTNDPPVYLPEESRAACLTWEALDHYWALTCNAARAVSIRVAQPTFRVLAPDLISALYDMHWNFQTADAQAPVGGDVRVYAVFRRTASGWRFANYIEAPLAPIVYMRTLYEQQVDEDFRARP